MLVYPWPKPWLAHACRAKVDHRRAPHRTCGCTSVTQLAASQAQASPGAPICPRPSVRTPLHCYMHPEPCVQWRVKKAGPCRRVRRHRKAHACKVPVLRTHPGTFAALNPKCAEACTRTHFSAGWGPRQWWCRRPNRYGRRKKKTRCGCCGAPKGVPPAPQQPCGCLGRTGASGVCCGGFRSALEWRGVAQSGGGRLPCLVILGM